MEWFVRSGTDTFLSERSGWSEERDGKKGFEDEPRRTRVIEIASPKSTRFESLDERLPR